MDDAWMTDEAWVKFVWGLNNVWITDDRWQIVDNWWHLNEGWRLDDILDAVGWRMTDGRWHLGLLWSIFGEYLDDGWRFGWCFVDVWMTYGWIYYLTQFSDFRYPSYWQVVHKWATLRAFERYDSKFWNVMSWDEVG